MYQNIIKIQFHDQESCKRLAQELKEQNVTYGYGYTEYIEIYGTFELDFCHYNKDKSGIIMIKYWDENLKKEKIFALISDTIRDLTFNRRGTNNDNL